MGISITILSRSLLLRFRRISKEAYFTIPEATYQRIPIRGRRGQGLQRRPRTGLGGRLRPRLDGRLRRPLRRRQPPVHAHLRLHVELVLAQGRRSQLHRRRRGRSSCGRGPLRGASHSRRLGPGRPSGGPEGAHGGSERPAGRPDTAAAARVAAPLRQARRRSHHLQGKHRRERNEPKAALILTRLGFYYGPGFRLATRSRPIKQTAGGGRGKEGGGRVRTRKGGGKDGGGGT